MVTVSVCICYHARELNSSLYENCGAVKSPRQDKRSCYIRHIWTLYLSLLPHGLKIDSIASQPLLSHRWSHSCTTRFPRKSSKIYISIPATHLLSVTMCKFTDGVTSVCSNLEPVLTLLEDVNLNQMVLSCLSSTPPLSLQSGATTLSWSRTLCRNHISFYVRMRSIFNRRVSIQYARIFYVCIEKLTRPHIPLLL
jgi:hypothetical protein